MSGATKEALARRRLSPVAIGETLLDRVAQGVLVVSGDGKVTFANRRIAGMAGAKRSSLLGAPLLELVAQAQRERLGIALGAGREALTQQRFALLRSDASELPVLMTFAPLAQGHASCLVTDLRDQRRREESADRLSWFLAAFAHELRDILSPIRKSLRALGEAQGLAEGGRHCVESMRLQVERMLALVEDLRKING